MTLQEFSQTIESTLLAPTARAPEVEALCREAVSAGFAGVCVAPCRVAEAAAHLAGTAVRVVGVAGFPLGSQISRVKVAEVEELFLSGAHEVDLVFNLGLFLEGRLSPVSAELRDARRAAANGVLKVILETGALTPSQTREAAALALGAGADYLKTSTGFGPPGARIPDVRLLRQVAGRRCGVKASGGIRTFEQAEALLAAGADRLGASSALALWREAGRRLGARPRPPRGPDG
ncbi:MAG: deoxyribose-phosphate aldolase [Deferrisomatales bacterium]|nr:deoxyribose-phosphate aldolase [Deferrisomatales bacterium]